MIKLVPLVALLAGCVTDTADDDGAVAVQEREYECDAVQKCSGLDDQWVANQTYTVTACGSGTADEIADLICELEMVQACDGGLSSCEVACVTTESAL